MRGGRRRRNVMLKQAAFLYRDYLQHVAYVHVCAGAKRRSTLIWEGISASGLRRGEKLRPPPCWNNITYSVKNIYNLTYIFFFRLQHKSFISNLSDISYSRLLGQWIPWLKWALEASHLPLKTCAWDPDQCWFLINPQKKNQTVNGSIDSLLQSRRPRWRICGQVMKENM